MKLPFKTLERRLFHSGYERIIAVDEVGMGCLAGPVVVCAVLLDVNFYRKTRRQLYRLRDSKLLLPRQREKFAGILLSDGDFKCQLAFCRPKTIDAINIYQASRLAMRRAIRKLTKGAFASAKAPFVLVDGRSKIEGLNLPQLPIVKGDRKVFAIACASIIAKVARDKMMQNYARRYPGYGFEQHKGYGTKYHQVKLAALGPCAIHRRSFAPVAKLI